jgi:NAD(P)H-dependent FMN reductase
MTGTEVAGPLRVAVIIGSTREGRVGDGIGRRFAARAQQRDGIAVSVLDLADYDFPARYPVAATPSMAEFVAGVGRAEAFVVVTPEYNRSFPASLKQAIDYAYDEWRAKPVGFVSYGCQSDGLYAIEQLRTVFTELHVVTVRDEVRLNLMSGGLDGSADPFQAGQAAHSAAMLLNELIWWGLALRDALAVRPYVC